MTGATLNSYPACSQLEDFLIQRIQKEDPYVKYKCLLIIKVYTTYELK